ncbi:extracellular solute-binding protein family 5 [Kribbella flavida DSM 17836]|uniref:Extracellular solute-binding protein family 5 n=1 Tax=Kribbella flavida (strain DSM 17836 / JCM 10339 / NBRC 14399) TaxID=479435 RepID=D2PPS2_KRIFD|nr:ABC transporter substrate-binding protein [Kribbella flavida]ADB32846.1 extracellular solute-binding protein family 5 [Kribbella flavida DSM 17836]
MSIKRLRTVAALSAVAALALSACGGGAGNDNANGSGGAKNEFNAALTEVVNPSDKKGGTVKMGHSDTWDSLDPGETYYGYAWNFARLYGRSLLMFKPAPGKASNELVPDLAEGLGVPSEGGKTWTYKIRKGVKFDDGTEVKAKDVKHAVLRSTDKETFPNGPAYFEAFLNLPAGYKGPYKSKGVNTDSAISTPDDYTIAFHLKNAFGGFDYLAQLTQTMPVPEAKDTGAKYRNTIVSSGPYKFANLQPDKSFELVRNEQWDQATDPNRKALPDKYEVALKVNADDIDNRIISGDLDIDVSGTGVQPASLSKVLTDPALKAQSDNPTMSRLWYTSINPTVPPLNNVECRKAVQYAMDKTSYQTAYGGAFSGGDLATTIMPPAIPGYEKFDLYPAGQDNKGDLDKAKQALTACGQPNGFSTNMAYRSDRPREKATAEAFQQALKRVGINLTLKGYPSGDYFSQYAGNPPFVVANKIGLAANGWGADWNDGFGFLSQIVDSRVIRPTGGSSNTSVRIPEVDKMLDAAIAETDTAKREKLWAPIDKRVMEEAVIYPGVYAKSLLLRPKNLSNVFISDAFNMYDYLSLGVK